MPKSATFTAGGGTATLTFEWEYDQVKMSNLLNDAGGILLPPVVDPVTGLTGTNWGDFNNQQKVDFILAHVTQHLLGVARGGFESGEREDFEDQLEIDVEARFPGQED